MNGEDNYEHIMEARRNREEEANERHHQKTVDLMEDSEMAAEWLSKIDLDDDTELADELGDALINDSASRTPTFLGLHYVRSAAHGAADYFANYYPATPIVESNLSVIVRLMPEHTRAWKSFYEFCSEVVK